MKPLEMRAIQDMYGRDVNATVPLWVDALKIVAPKSYESIDMFVRKHQWQCDRFVSGLREAASHREDIYLGQMGELQYSGDETVSVHGRRYACQGIDTPDVPQTAKQVLHLLVTELTGAEDGELEERMFQTVYPPHWKDIASYIRQVRTTVNEQWDALVRITLQHEQSMGKVQVVLFPRLDEALEQRVKEKSVERYVQTLYEELGEKACRLPKHRDLREMGCAAFRFAKDYTADQIVAAMYEARAEDGIPLWTIPEEHLKLQVLSQVKTRCREVIKEVFFPIQSERRYYVLVEELSWKGKKEAQLRAFVGGK